MTTSRLNRTQYEVLRFITGHQLIRPGDSVCVCYSGGVDSSVLLDILYALRERIPIRLSACHMNHGIRGNDADRDEAFCREQALNKYGIPFYSVKKDIPSAQKQVRKSLEETGREVRYQWFEEIAAEHRIDLFATAHQKNDVAETVVYHMIRGTGIDGLCGIPVRRDKFIRPILFLSREDVVKYAEENGIPFVEDRTNDDMSITRNMIRSVILPQMEAINPKAVESIARLADYSVQERTFLDRCMPYEPHASDMKTLNPVILRRYISRLYEAVSGQSLCYRHLDALCDAVRRETTSTIELPGLYDAVCGNGSVRFVKKGPKEASFGSFQGTLETGIQTVHKRCRIVLGPIPDTDALKREKIHNLSTEFYLRKDGISGKIQYRMRAPGDHLTEFGISKKVKKLFIDRKIPPDVRPLIPILYDDRGILCVPFVGIADRAFTKSQEPSDAVRVVVTIDFPNTQKEGESQ